MCLTHKDHNPDSWSEITLNIDMLDVRTFITINILFLTATVKPILPSWFVEGVCVQLSLSGDL